MFFLKKKLTKKRMIQEDFITSNQNNSINNHKLDEETVIRSVFTPCYKKLESWNSQMSNNIYFIKESSKFPENYQQESIFIKKDSFNSIQDYDEAFDNLFGFNEDIINITSEKEDRLVNEENEKGNISHSEKADIIFANVLKEINDDERVVINIKDSYDFSQKLKEEEKVKETPLSKGEIVIPIKKKLKRGKRGPYKKKPKTIIQAKINDKYFPFTAGKGNLAGMKNTPFGTNKCITDKERNKKREKKQRKYKLDNIRKKIKVRFHKKIKNILNENLKNAGSNELFSFLPQFFVGNISKKFNYQYMDKTFEELLSINFSDFQKEYFNKDCDYKQFIKNKKTLEYLKNNPEISKISGFDKLKKMKYRELLSAYFSSLEFEQSIEQLEEENEIAEYIQKYIHLAKSYISYFTSSDSSL